MKIKNLCVQGFRGFNDECTIEFHDRLTLISAPNSYGKTSISESFEWLLYGITSKIERSDFKEEFKGSYRNIHLPDSLIPFVEVAFFDDNNVETEYHGDLLEGDIIQRSVNGKEVTCWPLSQDLSKVSKPFVLQHALKYLLLVSPRERFHGFARLLGLEELDYFHQNVVSLCTKPDAHIPAEVEKLLKSISALKARIESQPTLDKISKNLKKGLDGYVDTYKAILSECESRVPPDTKDESIIPELMKIREEAIDKIFKGKIELSEYSKEEIQINTKDEHFFLESIADPFIDKYTELIALATLQHIFEHAKFLDLGIKILAKDPQKCPFCGQLIDESLFEHINSEHAKFMSEKTQVEALQEQRDEVKEILATMKTHLISYHTRHKVKSRKLLDLEADTDKLKAILVHKYQKHFDEVERVISLISSTKDSLETSYSKAFEAIEKVEASIINSKEDSTFVKALGEALAEYIACSRSYLQTITENVASMSEADKVLVHELDILAGTEDITILIDLLDRSNDVEKCYQIKKVLECLKDLRRMVDQFCTSEVLKAISGELTSKVMEWYSEIKTEGDPEVHFDGFDIERTKKGDLKARRVQIKAKSYGRDLVSAVSSLSESKLNALGLCVSIATNLESKGPFDFLIIDDPIQSWDEEHEVQFIGVIRKLVELGKQVILLSHNARWIDMARVGCRTLNGCYYEITGYTKAGPHITELPWAKWSERLKEVNAIISDPNATRVKLQQAEEEIRIVNAELTSKLYFKILGVKKKPHNLNSTEIREILVKCGVESNLVDRITQTFETTDDAHHAGEDYSAHRQRIRKYHAWAHELAQLLGTQ